MSKGYTDRELYGPQQSPPARGGIDERLDWIKSQLGQEGVGLVDAPHAAPGFRTPQEQAELYVAGPGALISKHTQNMARDVRPRVPGVVTHSPDGSLTPEGEFLYHRMGQTAREAGMRWGGDFSRPDMPHLEMPRGRAGAKKDLENWLSQSGLTKDDLRNLRSIVKAQSENKKERISMARKMVRGLLSAAGDVQRKAAVFERAKSYAPSYRPTPRQPPAGYDTGVGKSVATPEPSTEPDFDRRWEFARRSAMAAIAQSIPEKASEMASELANQGPRQSQTAIGGDKVQVA